MSRLWIEQFRYMDYQYNSPMSTNTLVCRFLSGVILTTMNVWDLTNLNNIICCKLHHTSCKYVMCFKEQMRYQQDDHFSLCLISLSKLEILEIKSKLHTERYWTRKLLVYTSNIQFLRVFIDLTVMEEDPQCSLTALDKTIWMLQQKRYRMKKYRYISDYPKEHLNNQGYQKVPSGPPPWTSIFSCS